MSSSPPVYNSSSTFLPDIFKGKILFCTGGGSGICNGMVDTMMRHGVSAAIVGRNGERLAKAAQALTEKYPGQKCIPTQADVRKPDQLAEAVKKTIETFGKIDFVICGAAGNFLASIDGLSENAFKTVLEIDTMGTYNTVKATLPHVRKTRGAYIHISATLHYRGLPYQAHASAAKAGVDALSAVLAVEEGPRGIRSNVIAPGPVAGTAGMDRLSSKDDRSKADRGSDVPLQRWSYIDEMANAAVFLFSDAATMITGVNLVVDGGSVHVNSKPSVPYPESVLNPEKFKEFLRTKL
jgi:peroxisomal 2,4-dienoyl-CoA reductase